MQRHSTQSHSILECTRNTRGDAFMCKYLYSSSDFRAEFGPFTSHDIPVSGIPYAVFENGGAAGRWYLSLMRTMSSEAESLKSEFLAQVDELERIEDRIKTNPREGTELKPGDHFPIRVKVLRECAQGLYELSGYAEAIDQSMRLISR